MTTKLKTQKVEPTIQEAKAFAQRHGLSGLKSEYLARLRELIGPVAVYGQQVRRSPHKEHSPASEFTVFKP
jgi:hypothetical protein